MSSIESDTRKDELDKCPSLSSSSSCDYEMVENSEAGGYPVPIVKVTGERKFELDVKALGKILLRESVRDTPTVVVSIAGDYRKGKSFMLNHFLRYLQARCGSTNDWLADSGAPLKGFSWRGGSERDTTGILMWSEPFVIKTDDGKKLAIVLMDTQGAFDSEYTIKDCATVFALSTMTSSIQIFNIMHNLQEDNLQILDIFLEYGLLALESSHEKPFQKLVFLIRDWSFPYEHPYGFDGGRGLLEKRLELKETMPEQFQRIRRKIRQCFYDVGCFLMPHPGSRVATNPKFDGRTADYDPDFLEHLKQFIPDLLSADRCVPRVIGGREVTGRELLEYFKVYINVFAEDDIPEPKTMLEATAEVNNLTAVAIVKDRYGVKMEQLCGGTQPYVKPERLEDSHKNIKEHCLGHFDRIPKMGGDEFSQNYRQRLETDLDTAFKHFAMQNKSKNLFALFGAPLILMGALFMFVILSRFADVFGIETFSSFFNFVLTMDICILTAYVWGRYTCNYSEFVSLIDNCAELMWLFILDKVRASLS